jgi:hypothetical protein
VLLTRVFLFIPDKSMLGFPQHIYSCGKTRNWTDFPHKTAKISGKRRCTLDSLLSPVNDPLVV